MDTLEKKLELLNSAARKGNLSRRQFIELASIVGTSAAYAACGGGGGGNPAQPSPTPTPTPTPSGVAFSQPVLDFDTRQNIPGGNLYITMENGTVEVPFQNGVAAVNQEMGVQPNRSYQMRLSAPGYNDREFTGMVSNDGIRVDLMGGRMEYPLNMKSAAFNQSQYEYWRLRRDGHSQRPTSILTIGIADKFLYHASNGNLTRVRPFTMDSKTLNDIIDVVANDAPIWSGGLYPQENVAPGQLPSYVRMQSRDGDNAVPDSKPQNNGWILIYPDDNPSPGFGISRGDSGTDNITYAFMALGFLPSMQQSDGTIRYDVPLFTRSNLSIDLRECLGAVEHHFEGLDSTGKPLPQLKQYFDFAYARPPKHANPDTVVK